MGFEFVVGAGLALTAIALAIWSFAHLIWALLGQRGELRSRRLRRALSGFVIAAASVLTVAALYHSVLLVHPTIRVMHPDYDVPYRWVTDLLTLLMPLTIVVGVSMAMRWLWHGGVKRVLIAAVCVAAFALMGIANYALTYSIQLPDYERHVMIGSREWKTRVGESAPQFTVTMLDGTQVSLADLRGKVVLVNFFATWCGPCLNELPHLEELWDEVKTNDEFLMLVVGRGESQATAAAFKESKGFTFPIAVDPESTMYKLFADEGIPRTYLISSDGTILFQTLGYADLPVYQREFATLRGMIEEAPARPR
jgi:peroxiredoxin